MKYVKLGNSGLIVSKLALGTLDFGSHISIDESFRIMNRALELGINFWDTANSYGITNDNTSQFGLSESIIGEFFQKYPEKRKQVILNTKCFMKLNDRTYGPNDIEGISAYKMRRQLEDSLQRLKTDHVEIYTIHQYTEEMNWIEMWETYEFLMEAGKVYYAGASNFSAYAIAKAQQQAEKRNMMGFIFMQGRYNLSCRSLELEVIPTLKGEKMSLLAWSPLYGGRLSNKVFNPPSQGRKIRNPPKGMLADKLHKYAKLCHSYGLKEQDVALSWVMHNNYVDCVLTGANSVKELEDCVRCMELKLPQDLKEKLQRLFPEHERAVYYYMYG